MGYGNKPFLTWQGVFRALKTLKTLKTLNSENLTLKTLQTLKMPVFLRENLENDHYSIQKILPKSQTSY